MYSQYLLPRFVSFPERMFSPVLKRRNTLHIKYLIVRRMIHIETPNPMADTADGPHTADGILHSVLTGSLYAGTCENTERRSPGRDLCV